MMLRYLQIHLKFMLIGICILFVSNAYSQTKTDDELYAIWKDKSKTETVRLEAIWERLNIDTLTQKEPVWWKKWKPEVKEAIELAIKNNKKGYLPLFYISTLEDCAGNNDCMCTTANKIIESAKVANDSKLPILFIAYTGLLYSNCSSNIKDEEVINEFNKMKRNLKDNSNDNEMLRQASHQLGEWYAMKEKYPKALTYLLESIRISEELQLKDFYYARTNERLGFIHVSIGNYKEAEKYIDKSLQACSYAKRHVPDWAAHTLGKSTFNAEIKG
jgi:tetratricopeptide (TPR) repeat protein